MGCDSDDTDDVFVDLDTNDPVVLKQMVATLEHINKGLHKRYRNVILGLQSDLALAKKNGRMKWNLLGAINSMTAEYNELQYDND